MKSEPSVRSSASALARLALLAAVVAGAACATTKTPTLQVEALRMGKLGITGAGLDVGFRVQNPNPEPLLIDRFEYELRLNGHRLGRGYYSEPVRLDGFKAERVDSKFNLNFLSLPGTVKAILDNDRARVQVKGSFYVREGDGFRKLGFSHDANIDIGH